MLAPVARPRQIVRRTTLAGALLLAAAPAHAELDPAKLAASGQAILDKYVARADGQLQPQGKVTAIRDGAGVIVKLPALAIVEPEAKIDIPGAAIRLEEMGDADHVGFVVTLPDTIAGTRTAPEPGKLLIQLGTQKIDGVYRPSLLTFERFDMLLEDVTVDANDGGLTLAAVRGKMASAETAPGQWRTDARFGLGELRVRGPGNTAVMRLGSVEQVWSLDRYDLPRLAAAQREIMGGASPFGMMAEPDEEKALAMSQAWFARLPELLDGASGGFGMRLADLQVTPPDEPAFSLGALRFDLGVAPDEEFYGLALALAAEKPEVDAAALPVPAHLIPRRVVADLGLRRLPLAPLWAAMSGPMQQAMALEMKDAMTPEAKEALDQQFEMMPMAAMGMAAEAGSFAEIKSFELEIGPARLTAMGVGPLVPGLPEPPLRIEATIEGLDDLAAEVQKLDPEIQQQAMPIVVLLRGLGKPAARNDKIHYTYLIEQAPDGNITVNGASMAEMGMKPPQ